jgi:hypothetical protein
MNTDESRAAQRGRLMDEHRAREALRKIQEAPARRAAFRRHLAGECLTVLLLGIMLSAYLFHI